jgi:hypothetical protein
MGVALTKQKARQAHLRHRHTKAGKPVRPQGIARSLSGKQSEMPTPRDQIANRKVLRVDAQHHSHAPHLRQREDIDRQHEEPSFKVPPAAK